MEGRTYKFMVGAVVLPLVLIGGCHTQETPPYRTFASPPVANDMEEGGSNAFTVYASAARKLQAETGSASASGSILNRVTFFPKQRKEAIKLAGPAIHDLAQATKKRCFFRFVARDPFTPSPYTPSWRLIGRALQWRINDACSEKRYDDAIRDVVIATKFGFDLTGGDAEDASLGFFIVDDARKTIAPHLQSLSSQQLRTLSAGIKRAYLGRPSFESTLDHERQNMLAAVQYIQDSYRRGDYATLTRALGDDAKPAVKALAELKSDDAKKRPEYFDGLVADADYEYQLVQAWAKLPVAKREEPKRAKTDRPWRRFSKHFFGTCRPMLSIYDASIARTRLLVLESELLRMVKLSKQAPRDLRQFTAELTMDPYSGAPFVYRAEGQEYALYSVGADLIDNGGQTDETFSHPDLRLEKGS